MRDHEITREELKAAAREFALPGVPLPVAFVLAYATLAGEPLDIEAFDDSAVVARARRLVEDGVGLSEALRTAHAERVTWRIPEEAA